jgi:ATP-dependent 26S proteasome regulatory subunit
MQTKDFSGADLKATCVEAGMIAIRENRDKVTNDDFKKALGVISKKRTTGFKDKIPDSLYQ